MVRREIEEQEEEGRRGRSGRRRNWWWWWRLVSWLAVELDMVCRTSRASMDSQATR